ncbi:unnamed protein product [Spirodela intermedia]|uniref:Uncharacterized protein n=1 Tax=Spirodela intermedia TaxID=51605 RepID=A0A7I8I7F4_SPIIN|nr:unnamed protein product [Spirodela intermedia]CAA6653506.1 unnamed protein product [Spirodela intermedia]
MRVLGGCDWNIYMFSPSIGRFQYLCGLRGSFSILWTQDQPFVDSRSEISSFCGFKARSFQLRHVLFRFKVVILLLEYTAKAKT